MLKLNHITNQLGVTKEKARSYAEAIYEYSFIGSDEIIEASRNISSGKITTKAERYAYDIEDYLEKAPRWEGGKTYRIMHLPTEEIVKLKDGLRKNEGAGMQQLSSWTSSKVVATKKLRRVSKKYKDDEVVVLISGTQSRGSSITHLSYFPEEAEVLASRKSRYKYIREKVEGKVHYIYVKSL